MSIYEILPALDLTQSVHAKISIGMHRVVKFKISRIPLINTKLFHQLVNNERKCSNGTSVLEVKDKMYYGPDQIAHGFREHFLELSNIRHFSIIEHCVINV
jgi:hypothetical protein